MTGMQMIVLKILLEAKLMFEKLLGWFVKLLGYEINLIGKNETNRSLFSQTQYLSEDGSFDYEIYRLCQEEGNKRKIDSVWVKEENIEFLSKYIKHTIKAPTLGICHGTRRGKEQAWFRKYLECEVIGTEISDTATNFPHTIQWDFHKVKPEWIESVSFIYSNSMDHSYDPESCLNAWMSCLPKHGLCVIEHSSLDGYGSVDELDAFGADISVMPYLITLWGNGSYCVREILEAPRKAINLSYLYFIVIQKL
jgi:hypothetical protein